MKIIQVDAFTDVPFRGNPAAVCVLTKPREVVWMQHIAREMNLPETAFVIPQAGAASLRWFTPTTEVDLCGHATLATAHVLWELGLLQSDEIAQFDTLSGRLTARRDGRWIELDFPSEPSAPATTPRGFGRAFEATLVNVEKNRMDYVIELESEAAVRSLKPDLSMLSSIAARGFIVTARATTEGADFISRAFFPSLGIDEDPVTGSAHCCLSPYWASRLGKDELVGYQASSRGGYVVTKLMGDRVLLRGQAVTIFRGEISTEAM